MDRTALVLKMNEMAQELHDSVNLESVEIKVTYPGGVYMTVTLDGTLAEDESYEVN